MPKDTEENNPLTRVIFRDLELTKESKEELESKLGQGYFTEIKAENLINKTTGKAESPRLIERAAGKPGEITVTSMKIEMVIGKPIKFIIRNNLGGSGSRGYGKVEYKKLAEKNWEKRVLWLYIRRFLNH